MHSTTQTSETFGHEPGRWQWHPQLRMHWANERLYFWRISFPIYERARYVEDIHEVFRRTGVVAYAIYELYGGYDMLVRAWLPTTQRVFEKAFADVFHDQGIVLEAFSVIDVISHWPWVDDEGQMRLLDDALLGRPPNRTIERINKGIELPELAKFQENGMIAPSWHSQGIKFIVLIDNIRQSVTSAHTSQIATGLQTIVNEADPDLFSEKSLYKGMGFAAYLILGRVVNPGFHHIERVFTDPINDLISHYGSRTRTFTMSTEDFLAFSDSMRLAEESSRQRTALEWLEEGEGQHCEVKGSAFHELNVWLASDELRAQPPRSDIPTESLARAVCAFLNAEGGTVVLGALEASRFGQRPQLSDAPSVGEFLVSGLLPDLDGKAWDVYLRRIRDVLSSRIYPDPNDYLELEPDGVEKRLLCLIASREPKQRTFAGPWFYHHPKGSKGEHFWVREGNRTVEKTGSHADAYKAEKTRRAIDP